jgi:hypothetical protein
VMEFWPWPESRMTLRVLAAASDLGRLGPVLESYRGCSASMVGATGRNSLPTRCSNGYTLVGVFSVRCGLDMADPEFWLELTARPCIRSKIAPCCRKRRARWSTSCRCRSLMIPAFHRQAALNTISSAEAPSRMGNRRPRSRVMVVTPPETL